jgi:hypothetical protein
MESDNLIPFNLAETLLLDSAEFDPFFTRPFVVNPKGYLGECIGR